MDAIEKWHATIRADKIDADSETDNDNEGEELVPGEEQAMDMWTPRFLRVSHSNDFRIIRRVLPPTTLGRGVWVNFGDFFRRNCIDAASG